VPKPPRLNHAGLIATSSAESLAVRAGQGDVLARDCFGELVTRYQVRLFNFLLRRVRSRQDAEDLTQEAFVRAWERIRSYNPSWRFSTWLFTIGSRLAITRHRRSRPCAGSPAVESAPQRERPAPAAGAARIWHLAASCLSEDQHTALWLRYVEDLAIDEISVVMDKSQVAVRVCLFRARQALAARLPADQAADCDDLLPAAPVLGGVS
jgi:RNA polymerase sigma-70 factor, ECF subfamily